MSFHIANTNVASSARVYSMDDLNVVANFCVDNYIMFCISKEVFLEVNPETNRLSFPEDEITQDYVDTFASELTEYATNMDENCEETHPSEWDCFKTHAIESEYLTQRTREMIRQLTPTLKQITKDALHMSDNEAEDKMGTIEYVWFYYCYAILARTLNDMTLENTRRRIEEFSIIVYRSKYLEFDWMFNPYMDPE